MNDLNELLKNRTEQNRREPKENLLEIRNRERIERLKAKPNVTSPDAAKMSAMRAVIAEMAANPAVSNRTAYEGRFLFDDKKGKNDYWNGHLIKTGTRIMFDTKLMAAAADLWAYPSNTPDQAPTLWEHIVYHNGFRVLTGPITASNPVQPGEKCWENDVLYQCVSQASTTYRPSEYMAYWQVAE